MVEWLSQPDIEEKSQRKGGLPPQSWLRVLGATLGCTESGAQAFADKRGGREAAEEGWREGAAG